MRLVKVECENFRRFRKLSVDIGPGLIGVKGHNGSGKSSFLELIFYGLTGQPFVEASKNDLLRWGEKKGWVRHTIDTGDGVLVVERHLGREKVTMTLDGKTISGARAVNAAMEQLLPIPVEYLRDVLFVAQEKLDAPLSGTESARKDGFGRLFGCSRFDKLRDILQEAITRFSAHAVAPSEEQLVALTDALSALDQKIAEANLEQEQLEKGLKDVDVRKLYAIVSSPRQNDVAERRATLEKRQSELWDVLSTFTEEETRTFDRAGLDTAWRACLDKKTMHTSGKCPTCGHEVVPLSDDELRAIDEEIEAMAILSGRVKLFDDTTAELNRVDSMLASLPAAETCVTDEVVERAEISLKAAQRLDASLKEVLSNKRFSEGKREGIVSAIEEYHAQCVEARKVKGKLDLLTSVRDVLHRDALQAHLRKYGSARINEHLQVFSSLFNIPYRVFFTDEGLMRFTDPATGTEHDFIELSGGQRKLVALTYRLALMRLFTRGLNLAALDEPTAYVDEENVEAMREAFISLDEFARGVGMTAFVSTHEPALLPVFPRILEIADV